MKTFLTNFWVIVTSKRLKSFYWRTGMMALSVVVTSISENIGLFELPQWGVVILGLGLGEVSKAINNFLIKYKEEYM